MSMQVVQLFFTKNKKTITKLIKLGWLVVIISFIATTKISNPDEIWRELGKKAGTISLVTFWLTLLPGIMKRLRIDRPAILLTTRTLLMLYRRQMGITMYVFALVHFGWVRILPVLAIGGNLLDVSLFEIMGFLAFALATPLFLTSNNFSQNGKFKKIWPILHKLSYIIIWALFLHTILNKIGTKAIITLIIAVLEIVSLLTNWRRKKQAKV